MRSVTPKARSDPRITVTIQRQVTINDGTGYRIARSYTIGDSSLLSVPPGYIPSDTHPDIATVDYEGEIRLVPNLTTGGFDMGILKVQVSKDNFMLV